MDEHRPESPQEAMQSTSDNDLQRLEREAAEALDRGDNDVAIKLYLDFINEVETPEAAVLNKIGIAYARAGLLENAEEAFTAALEIDARHSPSLSNLGNIHFSRKEYGRAVELYKEAIKHDPDYGTAYNNLAAAYKKQGKISEAVVALKKSQKLQLQNPPSSSYPAGSEEGSRRRGLLGCLPGSILMLIIVGGLFAVLTVLF